MSLADSFRARLTAIAADSPDTVLLPDRIARACAAVLPVDGAGVSYTFTPDRRLPIGASDPVAATAERLQFTVGDGPCLRAQRDHRVLTASLDQLHAAWPVYTGELTTQTPYRSVAATPVGGELAAVAAIDVYLCSPAGIPDSLTDELATVATAVGEALLADVTAQEDRHLRMPSWMDTGPLHRRHLVWLAAGYLTGSLGGDDETSMARLRGLAFVHDLDLETAARDLVSGAMPME